MKNEQILEFHYIENEPHNSHVYVNYELEGTSVETFIPYHALVDYINANRENSLNAMLSGLKIKQVDFNEDDIEYGMPKDTLEGAVKEYIKAYLRFDLILENRKLRRKLQMAHVTSKCIEVSIAALECIKARAERYLHDSNVLTRHLNPYYYRYLGEAALCKIAINLLQDTLNWNKNNVA